MGSNGGDPADQSCRASSVFTTANAATPRSAFSCGLEPPRSDVDPGKRANRKLSQRLDGRESEADGFAAALLLLPNGLNVMSDLMQM